MTTDNKNEGLATVDESVPAGDVDQQKNSFSDETGNVEGDADQKTIPFESYRAEKEKRQLAEQEKELYRQQAEYLQSLALQGKEQPKEPVDEEEEWWSSVQVKKFVQEEKQKLKSEIAEELRTKSAPEILAKTKEKYSDFDEVVKIAEQALLKSPTGKEEFDALNKFPNPYDAVYKYGFAIRESQKSTQVEEPKDEEPAPPTLTKARGTSKKGLDLNEIINDRSNPKYDYERHFADVERGKASIDDVLKYTK